MKVLLKHLLAAALVALAVSCAKESGRDLEIEECLPVHLTLELPDNPATRANVVYGSETISTLWLLCFNQVGSCVGCVEATVSETAAITVTPGIPRDTRSIHFIGNKDLTAVKESVIGQQERHVLEETPELRSSSLDPVAFWGWIHRNTVGEMMSFVNASTPNKVYLLRDRAKLLGGVISDSDIKFITWTVSRRLIEGYIAPYPYEDYYAYDSEQHKYVGTTTVTPRSAASRYTATEEDFIDFDKPLYLFEDANTFTDHNNLLQVVLKVTYTNLHVRYHNIVIMDEDYVTMPVVRSHSYTFNIGRLPEEMGFDTLSEALSSEVFSNNYFISIDRDAGEVTDGTYSLRIDDPQGTHILYQSGVSKAIQFTYLMNGLPETGRTVDDFLAMWLENDGLVPSDKSPVLTYDDATGIGAVIFSLESIDATQHQGLLLLQDTKHGLSRMVEVYAVDRFRYAVPPSLTKVEDKQHNGHDVYKLSFTLQEDYPACFYPVNVIFTSMTLSPFSDSSPDAEGGTFSVDASGGTADLPGSNSYDMVNNIFDWNYRAQDWGYWFNYSFTAPKREVNIYLEDVTGTRAGKTFNSVGLYLRMPRFGADQALNLNK